MVGRKTDLVRFRHWVRSHGQRLARRLKWSQLRAIFVDFYRIGGVFSRLENLSEVREVGGRRTEFFGGPREHVVFGVQAQVQASFGGQFAVEHGFWMGKMRIVFQNNEINNKNKTELILHRLKPDLSVFSFGVSKFHKIRNCNRNIDFHFFCCYFRRCV